MTHGSGTALGTAEGCKGHLAQVRISSIPPLLQFATKQYQISTVFLFTLLVLLSHEAGCDVFGGSREVLVGGEVLTSLTHLCAGADGSRPPREVLEL